MRNGNPFFGATFAERKAARLGDAKPAKAKAVDADESAVEDKSVGPAEAKTRPRRSPRKKD